MINPFDRIRKIDGGIVDTTLVPIIFSEVEAEVSKQDIPRWASKPNKLLLLLKDV